MNKPEDIFKSALSEIKADELANLPSEDEIDYEFSRNFNENFNELVKLQKEKKKRKSIIKRMSIIAVAAALFLLTMLYASADRDRPFEFFYRLYNQYYVLDFESSETPENNVFTIYKLPYIPDGFVLQEEIVNSEFGQFRVEYKHPDFNEELSFMQLFGGSLTSLISSELKADEILVNDTSVFYLTDELSYLCYWSYGKHIFKMTYPSELGKEFMYKNIGKLIVDYVVYPETITESNSSVNNNYP